MTAPTISAVTPSTVNAPGGGMVRVTGTGFRLYVAPSGQYVGDHGAAVGVLFGASASALVEVLSATELWARVPPYAGDPAAMGGLLPLTVRNLADDGTPIPGEAATRADAFRYRYTDLTADFPGTAALEALKALLARELTPWVYHLTAADYDDTPDALDRVAEPAAGPYLVLVGPNMGRSTRRRLQLDALAEGGGLTTLYREAAVRDLAFTLFGGASGAGSTRVALNLMQLVDAWQRRELYVAVADGPGATVRCPVYLGPDWAWLGGTDPADRRRFSGALRVEGVPVDVPSGLVAGKTAEVDTTALEAVGV